MPQGSPKLPGANLSDATLSQVKEVTSHIPQGFRVYPKVLRD